MCKSLIKDLASFQFMVKNIFQIYFFQEQFLNNKNTKKTSIFEKSLTFYKIKLTYAKSKKKGKVI